MGKAKHNISNWAEYNRALVNRGSLTFWIDDAAIRHWYCQQHHGGRGSGFEYSDTAIETALMLKGLFGLPLRALEGFINSLSVDGTAAHFAQLQLYQQARQDGQYPLPLAQQEPYYPPGY